MKTKLKVSALPTGVILIGVHAVPKKGDGEIVTMDQHGSSELVKSWLKSKGITAKVYDVFAEDIVEVTPYHVMLQLAGSSLESHTKQVDRILRRYYERDIDEAMAADYESESTVTEDIIYIEDDFYMATLRRYFDKAMSLGFPCGVVGPQHNKRKKIMVTGSPFIIAAATSFLSLDSTILAIDVARSNAAQAAADTLIS